MSSARPPAAHTAGPLAPTEPRFCPPLHRQGLLLASRSADPHRASNSPCLQRAARRSGWRSTRAACSGYPWTTPAVPSPCPPPLPPPHPPPPPPPGGAPLARHVEDFLKVTMCCRVVQGYGLTETCAASFIAVPDEPVGCLASRRRLRPSAAGPASGPAPPGRDSLFCFHAQRCEPFCFTSRQRCSAAALLPGALRGHRPRAACQPPVPPPRMPRAPAGARRHRGPPPAGA